MAEATREWEYHVFRLNAAHMGATMNGPDSLESTMDSSLADLGRDGWELVSAIGDPGQNMILFSKRPKSG